jgi:hypothetical protein
MSKNNAVYWVVSEVGSRNAGYRVRVAPLAKALENSGISVKVLSLGDFVGSIAEIAKHASLVIIAKPGESITYLCIKYLMLNRVAVLLDLFDNYFAWSPLIERRKIYWQWLRAIEACSGVIVSTSFLAETVRKLSTAGIHLVSDPWPDVDGLNADAISSGGKWDNPEQIDLLWFGINGNPYYYAGLEDLLSWIGVIGHIRDRIVTKFPVRLTICTKRVPAVEQALLFFRSEGINTRFIEWSEDICNELLHSSHVVLIPTNQSGFSLSKTHNRCSDSIVRQCLVLASPGGPYKEIPGAVFRDVDALCRMLADFDPERIKASLKASIEYLAHTYSLASHSTALASYILNVPKPKEQAASSRLLSPPPVLIVGGTNSTTVKLSRTLSYLTAGFEGTRLKLNYDFFLVVCSDENSSLMLHLSDPAWKAVQRLMAMDVDIDWIDENHCRQDGMTIEKNEEDKTLRLIIPELSPLIQKVGHLRAIGDGYDELHRQMLDVNIEILTVVFKRLGFTELDLAADDPGWGWEGFARHAAPSLASAVQGLRKTWQEYRGNERLLGEPSVPVVTNGESHGAC